MQKEKTLPSFLLAVVTKNLTEKDIIKEIIAADQSFLYDMLPQGFFLLPNASRQCADIPIAKK
jgi:hypothetical protein